MQTHFSAAQSASGPSLRRMNGACGLPGIETAAWRLVAASARSGRPVFLCALWLSLIGSSVASATTIEIVAGGDVMFGRYSNQGFRSCGGPEALSGVTDLLTADVVLVNLEAPATERSLQALGMRSSPSALTFRANLAELEGLRSSGVTALSLANNHAEDCGDRAMLDTLELTAKAGMKTAGISDGGDPFEPTRWTTPSGPVALFAATTKRNRGGPIPDGRAALAFRPFREMGAALSPQVSAHRAAFPEDLILVSLHWGAEGKVKPYPGQRRLARQLIDAGANAIVGHHPHVLQPIEIYGSGVILYSLGNLVFDMRAQPTRETALVKIGFRRDPEMGVQAEEVTVHPLRISPSSCRPEPLPGTSRFMKDLKRRSKTPPGTAFKWSGQSLVWDFGRSSVQ